MLRHKTADQCGPKTSRAIPIESWRSEVDVNPVNIIREVNVSSNKKAGN
jgi:hypothetical protein